MRPVDRRLLRQAGAARGYLAVTAGLGLAGGLLILPQAELLSRALAGAARGTGTGALAAVLAWLAMVLTGRALAAAGSETAALRAAAVVKSGLRQRLSAHVLRLGPRWLGRPAGRGDHDPRRRVSTRSTPTSPGAGKSSLLALLLGLVMPASGTITAGGTDLAGSRATAGSQIAWVPQHPHLFAATVAGNIALGQPAAHRAEIAAAARLAGADDFIRRLPGGFNTVLTERAGNLSAGQRQKIALARAILRRAPVLLLDEPAAHLDPASADQVMTAIDTRMAGRTVVLVTHRPPPAGHGHRILALDRRADPRGPSGAEGDRTGQAGGDTVSSEPGIGRRDPLLRLVTLARPWRGRLLWRSPRGRRRGLRRGAAGGLRIPAGPRITAARRPGHLDGRGRGAGAQRRPRGLPFLERRRPDAAFRILADVRVSIYRRLERLAPAGLTVFSSGDLLTRLISDVDATQDLFIRGIAPPLAAAQARRVGHRLPGDSHACRVPASRQPAGRRDRPPGARRRGSAGRRQAPGSGPRAAGRDVHRPSRGRRRTARLWRPGHGADPGDGGRQGPDQAGRPELGGVRPQRRAEPAIAGLTVWGVLLLGVAATGDGALTGSRWPS